MLPTRFHRSLRSEQGMSLVEMSLVVPVLLLILIGIVDFGRAYYLYNEVVGAAHAGAIYGSQFPTDTTGMQTAVTNNAPDVSGLQATATYGCECYDGSDASASCASPPSCTTNEVYYVHVTASATYTPLVPWPGIPTSVPMSETVELRSAVAY